MLLRVKLRVDIQMRVGMRASFRVYIYLRDGQYKGGHEGHCDNCEEVGHDSQHECQCTIPYRTGSVMVKVRSKVKVQSLS